MGVNGCVNAGISKSSPSSLIWLPSQSYISVVNRLRLTPYISGTVLAYFGSGRKEAILRYEMFVQDGVFQGTRPHFVPGGLIRSAGAWSRVLSLRRKALKVASDDRIVGSGQFVKRLLSEANKRQKETLRLSSKVPDWHP